MAFQKQIKLVGTAIVLGAALVTPAAAADADAGKALALQWCSSCHLVSNDQSTASSTSLPSFFDMAKDAGWTEDKLKVFLANPHPKMPNMTLSNNDISDLSRYISTLAN